MPATQLWLARKRLKMLLLFCVAIFVVFFVMSWSSYQVATTSISQQIEKNSLPLTSDNVYSQIQRDLVQPTLITSLMAHDTFVRDWALEQNPDADKMHRYLKEIDSKFGTHIAIFVLDKNRMAYLPDGSASITELQKEASWYDKLKSLPDDKPYDVGVGHDPENHERVDIFINHKVYDYQGNFIGAVGIGLSVKEVQNLINQYQQQYQRAIYFVDDQGNIMLQGKGQKRLSLSERPGIAKIYPSLFKQPDASFHFVENNQKVFVNTRLVNEFNWYLVVEEQVSSSESEVFSSFIINVLIAAAITLVVLVVSLVTQSRFQKKLALAASVDPLTGACNRRSGEQIFTTMRSESMDTPMALMVLDIDHFKQINDTYGHDAGDQVLKRLVTYCQQHIRQTDFICRWGGEEFVLLFNDCEKAAAVEITERMRQGIEQLEIPVNGNTLKLTVSGGMVMVGKNGVLNDWVNQADEALYRAKQQGRNRILWHESAN